VDGRQRAEPCREPELRGWKIVEESQAVHRPRCPRQTGVCASVPPRLIAATCPKTNDCGQSSQICSKYSLLDCGRRAINGHWFRTESRQCPAASPASGFHHPAKPRRTRSQEIEAARVRGRPAPRRLRDRVRAVLLTVSSGRQIFGRPRCTGTGSTPLVTGQIPGQSGPRRLLVFRKNVPKNR
jgi:hypothetical protein